MLDIVLESLRTVVIGLILLSLWRIGRQRQLYRQRGWRLILLGWSLIFIGSLFDITDNFESLNRFVLIGDTEPQALVEKVVGFLFGFVALFFGFLFWIPANVRKVDRMKRDFVSTVSHELRTPLTAIHGALRLMESGKLGEIPEKSKDALDISVRNSNRLLSLVNDILDLDSLETGNLKFEFRHWELSELVGQAIRMNEGYAVTYNVRLKSLENPPSGKVRVDSYRFLQVIGNVLSNAIKFSPSEGSVTTSIKKQGGFFRVSVSDTGPGIPEEVRSAVFDKFVQADSSSERKRMGTGLGLAIVKELVTRMGGKISFETKSEEGTTFHVDLPEAGRPFNLPVSDSGSSPSS